MLRPTPWPTVLCVIVGLTAGGAHAAEPDPERELAIGLLADWAPRHSGSGHHHIDAEPVVYIRWGRWSLSNRSGFVNRRNDAVVRGIGVDLVTRPDWRLATSLRYDGGRDRPESGELAGLDEIRATVRLRVSAVWRPPGTRWRLGAAWNGDAAGRGGGSYSEASIAREWLQDADAARDAARGRTWTLGVAVAAGDSRYLQNHYGVTPAQSERTGYPVYTPGAGLRDATLFGNLRWSLSKHWVVMGGVAYTRQLDAARASPLVRDASAVSASFGAAYSF